MGKVPYIEEMAIVGMLRSEMNIQQIREKTGYSQCTVSRIAKKYNMKPMRSYTRITPEIIEGIMQLDKSGMSHSQIAAQLQVGTSTVNKIIRKQKAESSVEQRIDEISKPADQDAEEIQLEMKPEENGADLMQLLDAIQKALKEINGAIELIKERYYESERN